MTNSRIDLIASLLEIMVNNPSCQSLKLHLFFEDVEFDLTVKTKPIIKEDKDE